MGGISSSSSVTTGNGLSGTGTAVSPLLVASPSFNSIGSYVWGFFNIGAPSAGSNYSAGSGANQVQSSSFDGIGLYASNSLSGTWKSMGGGNSGTSSLFCRVA